MVVSQYMLVILIVKCCTVGLEGCSRANILCSACVCSC